VAKDEDLSLTLPSYAIRSDPEHRTKKEIAEGEEHRAMIQTPWSGR
jgi:hypothetical protein